MLRLFRRRRFRWLLWAVAAVLLAVTAYFGWYGGRVLILRDHNPVLSSIMAQRLADRPGRSLKQYWVAYDRIATSVKRAVIASEDAKFAAHGGFDWEGIEAAVEKNLREMEIVAGGSTITQQLAKNLFLSGDRSLVRKGQEAVLTVMLETLLSKRRILELYLNVAEWGDGIFGIEAAARHYMGVSAERLSARQAARLASMLPRPRFYHREGVTPLLEKKTEIILGRMHLSRVP